MTWNLDKYRAWIFMELNFKFPKKFPIYKDLKML